MRSHQALRAGRRGAVLCTLAATLAILVYLNALGNPFVYDDFRVVVENTGIQDVADWWAIVVLDPTRPLVNFTYALDLAVWGVHPFGFHLTNLLLHGVNVVLLFVLAVRVAEDRRHAAMRVAEEDAPLAAFTTAALFAVHPILSQAVGYVAGRAELLCGAFVLCALLAARRWMLGAGPMWWLLALLAWLAAVASKEVGAMLPFVLPLYERLILRIPGDARRRVLWRLHAVLLGLGLLAVTVRVAVLMTVQYPGDVTVEWRYVLVQFDVVLRYLTLLAVPSGQTVFHAVTETTLADARTWIAIAVVTMLVAGAILARRRAATASFGVLWFLLLLVPSMALVVFDRGEPMAEHRVYVASMGLFLAAGAAVATLVAVLRDRPLRLLVYSALALVIAGLAGRTVIRNVIWSSPVTLWAEAVDQAPDHWFPRLLLGEALHAAGRRDEAIAEFRQVIALRPGEAAAYQKLALAYAEAGRYDAARATFVALGEQDPRSPLVSNGLGALALLAGDREAARAHFLESMTRDPGNVGARQALAAMAEEPPGDFAEALRLCREIQQLAPRTPGNDDCIRRNQARLSQ